MPVRDIHKSTWCVEGRHARCHGPRVCNCACHVKVRVRDMISSLKWGTVYGGAIAHIVRTCPEKSLRAECGIYCIRWERSMILDVGVCWRCLKATEKYA